MTLNWLDIVIIVLLAASVAEGIAKGFARTGIGFAAALLGILLGIWFYGAVGYFLLPVVKTEATANSLGFIAIFLCCLIAGALLGAALAALLKWAGLSFVDRVLGAAMGVLRGAAAGVALVLILIAFTPNSPPASVVESRWAPHLVGAANIVAEFAPRELKDGFFQSYEKLERFWKEHIPPQRLKLPETEV